MKKLALTAIALGVFTGIGGASHGPGEILQGNVAPDGLMIQAWPSLTALGGEPAMTVIPSLLIAGILTLIVGAVVALWAAKSVERKYGGALLIALSLLLLIVGGGIVPPLFGIAAGIIATVSSYQEHKVAA